MALNRIQERAGISEISDECKLTYQRASSSQILKAWPSYLVVDTHLQWSISPYPPQPETEAESHASLQSV